MQDQGAMVFFLDPLGQENVQCTTYLGRYLPTYVTYIILLMYLRHARSTSFRWEREGNKEMREGKEGGDGGCVLKMQMA